MATDCNSEEFSLQETCEVFTGRYDMQSVLDSDEEKNL